MIFNKSQKSDVKKIFFENDLWWNKKDLYLSV